ncbi:MAG: hypothetical protein ACOC44_19025 [Promethearchaeia archaeon]
MSLIDEVKNRLQNIRKRRNWPILFASAFILGLVIVFEVLYLSIFFRLGFLKPLNMFLWQSLIVLFGAIALYLNIKFRYMRYFTFDVLVAVSLILLVLILDLHALYTLKGGLFILIGIGITGHLINYKYSERKKRRRTHNYKRILVACCCMCGQFALEEQLSIICCMCGQFALEEQLSIIFYLGLAGRD